MGDLDRSSRKSYEISRLFVFEVSSLAKKSKLFAQRTEQ